MDGGSGRYGRAFALSVLIGAYLGILTQMLVTLWGEPIQRSDLWALPVILLVYGLLALPFVALGLALFGLPATLLLRRRAQEWWIGPIAALWGAMAGKLTFYVMDQQVFLGAYDVWKVSIYDGGIIYGVPTALAWWLLYRRELSRQ